MGARLMHDQNKLGIILNKATFLFILAESFLICGLFIKYKLVGNIYHPWFYNKVPFNSMAAMEK